MLKLVDFVGEARAGGAVSAHRDGDRDRTHYPVGHRTR